FSCWMATPSVGSGPSGGVGGPGRTCSGGVGLVGGVGECRVRAHQTPATPRSRTPAPATQGPGVRSRERGSRMSELGAGSGSSAAGRDLEEGALTTVGALGSGPGSSFTDSSSETGDVALSPAVLRVAVGAGAPRWTVGVLRSLAD